MSDPKPSIVDSRVLAAMAHPVRRRLLDLLKVDGPATASTLARKTGEAVGNVSHHVRALAAAGLIEEAPELAKDRRERWWRRATPSLWWSSADFAEDAAGDAVARAVESLNLERQTGHVRRWADQPQSEQERWPLGPFSTEGWDVGLSAGATGVLIAITSVGGVLGAAVARRMSTRLGSAGLSCWARSGWHRSGC